LTQGDQGGRPLFWWPDSSRIGFISNGGKISAVSRLGGTPEVVQNDNFYFAATLSPDGKTLAAWRIDQPGGKTNATVVIASPPNGPFREYAPAPFRLSATLSPVRLAFAPDGKSLMLSMYENDGSPAMWQLPFPDGAPKKIVPANLSVSSPLAFSWMPDSRRAVVSAHGDLWMLDVASGATSAVSVGVATQTEPSVSPDGTRLAFMVGAANFDLGALPLDGSAMRDVFATAADESAGAWIAGGPRFLYVTTRSGHSVIRLRAPDGTDRPIVEAPAGSIVIGAVPSPDGQRVAYGQLHGAAGIWVVPLAGGEPTRISDGTLEFAPTWSPDGQRIAHVWFDNGVARLRVRRIGSSETPVAIPLIGDTGGMPEWSPDGQWIAMSSEKGIQLLSPDGKSHKEIAAHRGAALQWSSDSRTIYSVFNTQPDQMALASIDVQSGKEKVVCTLPRGVGISSPLSPSLRLTLSADGKSLLTTIVRSNTDIWTLDHFWR
jgi:Tol biopolymer transport system component